MDKSVFIVWLLLGIVIFGALGWQKSEINDARGQIVLLQKDLSAARGDAAGWKKAAEATGRAATSQAELADACLKREAQVQADRDNIAAIMSTAKPQPITPEQAQQGVDDATRHRVTDMLNRPL